MPKCVECGAETELHELGVPICPACISERERLHPSLDSLRAEVAAARERYRKAMEEFEHQQAMCRDLPKGHPDRTMAARLEENAKAAGERYWEILRAYSDALRRDSG
jgi:hypothetical protein